MHVTITRLAEFQARTGTGIHKILLLEMPNYSNFLLNNMAPCLPIYRL